MPSEILRNPVLIETLQKVSQDTPYISTEIHTLGPPPRTLEVDVAPLTGEGPRTGVVAVFHDITERKALDDMRRDFVANVSHELRTPLSAIRASVETLMDGALKDPKFARQFTEVIDRHVLRLQKIVDDLLVLARLESKDSRPPMEQLKVNELAESALKAVTELAAARDVTLEHEISDDELTMKGDRHQLEQALVNLLDNAIKYSEAKGRVALRIIRQENQVEFSVTDTGVGIPQEHLSRIFERFYRVDKNRSRDLGGTGLGLSIVKHIAQVHGGRVDVNSSSGRGSIFRLIIPA